MRDFILIDFLIEKVKKLFTLLETHNHDDKYYTKEEIDANLNMNMNPSKISYDFKIKEGNNAIMGGPVEIEAGKVLEIPKGSVLTIL